MAPSDNACLFCHGDGVFLRTGLVAARFDNFPSAPGHAEVFPLRHVESFFDLEPEEVGEMYAMMRSVRDAVDCMVSPDGYTIGVNEGPAAGRTVDHVHIHLIPRWVGDVENPRGGVRNVLPGGDYLARGGQSPG